MAKYYAIAILPKDVDVTKDLDTTLAVSKLMELLNRNEESNGNQYWDTYECCKVSEFKDWAINYGPLIESSSLFIFSAEALTNDGVPYAIITPEPRWIQSKATKENLEDSTWLPLAIKICQGYSGHYAVLLQCNRD